MFSILDYVRPKSMPPPETAEGWFELPPRRTKAGNLVGCWVNGETKQLCLTQVIDYDQHDEFDLPFHPILLAKPVTAKRTRASAVEPAKRERAISATESLEEESEESEFDFGETDTEAEETEIETPPVKKVAKVAKVAIEPADLPLDGLVGYELEVALRTNVVRAKMRELKLCQLGGAIKTKKH